MLKWLLVILVLLPIIWVINEERSAARWRRSQAAQRKRTPKSVMAQSKKEPPRTR